MNYVKIGVAARMMNVSTQTIRNWWKRGLIQGRLTPTGQLQVICNERTAEHGDLGSSGTVPGVPDVESGGTEGGTTPVLPTER